MSSSRYNRYSHREQPTKQELAAHRAHERRMRALAEAGHDDAANRRVERIRSAYELRDQILQSFPPEHHQLARDLCEKSVAEIRAEGPVGCTCTHPECVQTRPTL